MKKSELVKGLELIIEGATLIKEQLLNGEVEAEVTPDNLPFPSNEEEPKEDKKVGKKSTAKKSVKKEAEQEEPQGEVSQYTKEYLDGLKYNELKQLGASLGVRCTGKRDEITERILALNEGAEKEKEEEAQEEVKEDSKVVAMKDKKGLKKKKEETEIDEEFLKQAEGIMEETDESDIKDALSEVGIKVTKKDDLKLVLAKALSEGLLTVDDEEEEADEDVEDTEDAEMEFSPNSYFEQYDPSRVNDPKNMTKERLKAVKEFMEEHIEAIESEEITEDQIQELIQVLCTEEEIEELLGDEYEFEHLVAMYLEARKRMIDDEGEDHEPSDPYVINDENFCCGHELKYDKKHSKYICEVCGEEYEE